MVESPEGFFLTELGNSSEVAINEREFRVRDVEVENAFDEAFVETNVFEFRDEVNTGDDLFS